MNQAKIDLYIEELILRDVPYALRHRIVAAVEHELARLLSEQDLPLSMAQGAHIPQIDIGTIQLALNAKPDAIGAQIAQSVYQNLSTNNP